MATDTRCDCGCADRLAQRERPRLLDLFCGAGGAGTGYARAGFEVVGVDIKPQPRYPFPFVQADALRPPFDLSSFDAIHASPPCQAYSTMNNRQGSSSPPLIEATRALLIASGLPYIIENVAGAVRHLRAPVELTGEMFGLRTHRARLFECNPFLMVPAKPRRQHAPVVVYGKADGRRVWTRRDGTELRAPKGEAGRLEASAAMGIDWMEWDELRESIPPAFTEYLGRSLLSSLMAQGRADR